MWSDTRRAGLAFILGSVFFAYAFALRVSPSVMVGELMRDFSVGGAILGHLSAFYFYAYAGLQIPVGLLLDRLGPRRLIVPAATVVTLGCLVFALSERLGLAYTGRLAIGAGCAFSWAATLALVNQWFPTRFALLAGVSQFVAMAGAVLAQAPLALVVEQVGWRPSMLGFAMFGLVLTLSLLVVVRDKPRKSSTVIAGSRRSVITNPQTWLVALFTLTMTAPLLALGGLWGVPFLSSTYGLERTTAAAITSMVFVGNGVGCVLLGWWSDTIRRRRLPMFTGGVLTVVAQLVFIHVPGLPVAVLGLLAIGIGVGGSALVVGFACGREQNIPANVGLTIGIINTATTGSGALFQPVVGWLLDTRWKGQMLEGARVYDLEAYQFALSVLPAASLLGVLLVLAIRETYARPYET